MKNNIQKNSSKHFKKASTLIELLIYLAVVSITVTSMVLFAWNIITHGEKVTRQEEVSSGSALLAEKIKYEIRNANDINSVTANSISLSVEETANPTIIACTVANCSSGQVTIQKDGSAAIPITSPNINVNNLSFTKITATNINFTFTLVNDNPSPGNIYEHSTISSSVELRNK